MILNSVSQLVDVIDQVTGDSSSQDQPGFVVDAEAAAAFLRRQFDVVVDPEGRLIYARRHGQAGFVHCRPAATLASQHDRLERLLAVRAQLEFTRLVAEQVCHIPPNQFQNSPNIQNFLLFKVSK